MSFLLVPPLYRRTSEFSRDAFRMKTFYLSWEDREKNSGDYTFFFGSYSLSPIYVFIRQLTFGQIIKSFLLPISYPFTTGGNPSLFTHSLSLKARKITHSFQLTIFQLFYISHLPFMPDSLSLWYTDISQELCDYLLIFHLKNNKCHKRSRLFPSVYPAFEITVPLSARNVLLLFS